MRKIFNSIDIGSYEIKIVTVECYNNKYNNLASASVPTLGGTSVFTSIPSDCKIVVPDSLYDTWVAATNWSTYANNIIKASEFNG